MIAGDIRPGMVFHRLHEKYKDPPTAYIVIGVKFTPYNVPETIQVTYLCAEVRRTELTVAVYDMDACVWETSGYYQRVT